MISAEILKRLNTTGELLTDHLYGDVLDIFAKMVGTEITPAPAAVTAMCFKDSITAMVALAGSFNGTVSLTAPQSLAIFLASLMLGTEIEECDIDVKDAIGEIANMVGGSFKHHFDMNGHEIRVSIPSVMAGEDYVLSAESVPDTHSLLFASGQEHFLVSIFIEAGD